MFGASCDVCGIAYNNYSVEDIAYCNDCSRDLCDTCALLSQHSILREADVDQSRTRTCE